MLYHLAVPETEEVCERQPLLAWRERQMGVRYYHLALGNDALYFQVHLRELASHRMDERDECLRSIRDLRVVLDEFVADVLGDGRLRFAEVERRVQEPAGGCLEFFLSRELSLFSFFGVDA